MDERLASAALRHVGGDDGGDEAPHRYPDSADVRVGVLFAFWGTWMLFSGCDRLSRSR